MKISIRKANEEDFSAILSLIKELAAFVKASEKVTISVEQMKTDKDLFECFVAVTEDKEIVGIAHYFIAFYSWVGKSLYLDDLYIKEAFRGQQIGTKLLKKIFEIAKKENCQKVYLQVRKWNKPAIEMYEKFGAKFEDEMLNCSFDEF